MPRLTINSPVGSTSQNYGYEVNQTSAGDPSQYLGEMISHQQPGQPLDEYARSVSMSDKDGIPNFAVYGQENFPNLHPNMYDEQNDLDFGFSEFFGGYQELDFMRPPIS